MSTPATGEEESPAFQAFSKAERIQQLNDIDKVTPIYYLLSVFLLNHLQSITQLLQSAGLAIKTLTATQSPPSTPAPTDRREAFQEASNSYLTTLQSVDVRLRRQIYGLEEADIIPAEKAKAKGKEGPGIMGRGGGRPAEAEKVVDEGGMGKLDIGWLNSRSGRVGRDMEAELWEKAKGFLEGLEEGKSNRAEERRDDGEDQGTGS
jgi:hypothetical protein